jgi:hypothetical protein
MMDHHKPAVFRKMKVQRDMHIVKIVRELVRRGNRCIDMLTRSEYV